MSLLQWQVEDGFMMCDPITECEQFVANLPGGMNLDSGIVWKYAW
ncbi:hypothetical protein OPKNFCMD_5239 [Methylobacterium crusticola]|uniref:Uncharacterized protein n=1 Tax=Methylobacterium crusticola TaxID=1697972 RepID=A0ABQ4R4G3_9HYPH|nr:hypothetical protein [Methylobacterium crusticola]GJD52473.1 hypothetical protein OPKNFCMD_5239 [Methylobacterium crusticola]